MPLNARQVETAKPRDTAYKLSDGGGLHPLMVRFSSIVLSCKGSACVLFTLAGQVVLGND